MLKPSMTLMAFVLLYISTSSLQVVRAVPATNIFDPGLKLLEARHDENPGSTPPLGDLKKENGIDAQNLNKLFKIRKATDMCPENGIAGCIDSQFARCVDSKWVLTPCPSGTSCFALPLADEPGTVTTCKVPSEAEALFVAAGMGGGPDGGEEDCDDANGYPPDDDCDDNGPAGSMPTPMNVNAVVTTIVTTMTTTMVFPT